MFEKIVLVISVSGIFAQNANQLNPYTPKIFPPAYKPWEICFNPLYYGLQSEQFSQTSPVPQPNIYFTFPNAPNPETSSNELSEEASKSSAEAEIYTKTIRPGVTLRLRKPKFGNSTPSVENATESCPTSSGSSGLDKEARKMIMRFLELNSKRKKLPEVSTRFGKEENSEELDNGVYVSFRNRSSPSNKYSLPKFKYGNKREPVSVFDKAKFLTQL